MSTQRYYADIMSMTTAVPPCMSHLYSTMPWWPRVDTDNAWGEPTDRGWVGWGGGTRVGTGWGGRISSSGACYGCQATVLTWLLGETSASASEL